MFKEVGASGQWTDGYQSRYVTPYMHIMVAHFPAFVEKHNGIRQFSCQSKNSNHMQVLFYIDYNYNCQGVEKNNDEAKRHYFRNSNRKNAEADILSCDIKTYMLRHFDRDRRDYK